MHRCTFPAVVISLVILIFGSAVADEGMWPLYMLKQLPFDQLKARGLELTVEQIYNPNGVSISDAVVQCGATASFVSAEGLMITNHHVAYGAIQEQSTPEHNYLRDGYYAATREAELEAPGYSVSVNISNEDVTKRVLGSVNDKMSGLQRYNAIDKAIKQIIADGEKGTNHRCKVVEMFGGKQYVKYTSFELRDVRIVYVPPEAIGNFGGETDNWIWPRHTGDFSFLRAYIGPDGKPADFSKDNVPYHPKNFLPLSVAGVKDGDLTITIGFPGSTERYISSYELENRISFSLPNLIRNSELEIRITEEIGKTDSAIALRTANSLKGIYNYLKKSHGVLDGCKRTDALGRKLEDEKQLVAFIDSKPALKKQFGGVLPGYDSLYQEIKKTQLIDSRLGRLARAVDYYRLASTVYRWAVEREKPDAARERGYQNRDTVQAKRRLKVAQINLVPLVDRALLVHSLKQVLDLPAGQKIDQVEKLFAGKSGNELDNAITQYADDLYARTKVGNLDDRMQMFGMTLKQLQALDDPFIALASALYPDVDKIRQREKSFSGTENRLAPKLVQAYAEWKNGSMYPDANSTMRVSFGEVKGFAPKDAVAYHYHTLLAGVMQKETGEGEFVVPAELKATFASHQFGQYAQPGDDDIPVDFLTTNDITNGNSGSPVLNGKGEIIGLAFDGNYEGVASDYLYDPEMNRTIVVDTRFVLFVLDKVYHLDNLMKELTIH